MKINKRVIVSLTLLFLGIFLSAFPATTFESNATVVRVVDGDTIKVKYLNHNERVRLIGIDTPESSENFKALRDSKRNAKDIESIIALGKRAAEFTAAIVHPADKIMLEFDVEKRDKYGRLLAYVYLPSGEMLNRKIIAEGYAGAMTIPPNVKFSREFVQAQRLAHERKLGLWKE